MNAQLTQVANELLAGQSGAVVVMDAASGEILAMASQPGFDLRTVDEDWAALAKADDSPLVNRAVQLLYPPGTALGPFLLAAAQAVGLSAEIPAETTFILGEQSFDCVRQPADSKDWGSLVASACPGALAHLGVVLGGESLLALFTDLGFYAAPNLPLDLDAQSSPTMVDRPEASAIGQGGLAVSPLQMAAAACTLSNAGLRPEARIVLQVEQAGGGWQTLESGDAYTVLGGSFSTSVVQELAYEPLGIWEVTGRASGEEGQVYTWYLAGSLPDGSTRPRCAVVLLESDNRVAAQFIGRELLAGD
jgi:cell division protein FtsI/penicillin-binding protein 2